MDKQKKDNKNNSNRMKIVPLFIIVFCFLLTKVPAQNIPKSEVDSLNAIKIAKESWTKTFGKKSAVKFKPYYAELRNDSVWIVKGTLPQKKRRVSMGGVPFAEVLKSDGKILFIKHGK